MRSAQRKEWNVRCALLFICFICFISHSVSGSFPVAQNVTWDSKNFKTLLTWTPKPTNYSYTVEFSKKGEDRVRNPHCIQSSETECDLTFDLRELKAVYTADVLSEQVRGATTDLIEFPYTTSSSFCPYSDTIIGGPEFQIEVNKDNRSMTLHVKDVATALLNTQSQRMTIRDIFQNDLQYKVSYWKSQSSGRKEKMSASSEIEMTNLDQGESYCFTVHAYIPSRTFGKQLGMPSQVHCSPKEDKPFFEEYSMVLVSLVILIIVVVIAAAITILVVCYKRCQKAKHRGKEGMPLKEGLPSV